MKKKTISSLYLSVCIVVTANRLDRFVCNFAWMFFVRAPNDVLVRVSHFPFRFKMAAVDRSSRGQAGFRRPVPTSLRTCTDVFSYRWQARGRLHPVSSVSACRNPLYSNRRVRGQQCNNISVTTLGVSCWLMYKARNNTTTRWIRVKNIIKTQVAVIPSRKTAAVRLRPPTHPLPCSFRTIFIRFLLSTGFRLHPPVMARGGEAISLKTRSQKPLSNVFLLLCFLCTIVCFPLLMDFIGKFRFPGFI